MRFSTCLFCVFWFLGPAVCLAVENRVEFDLGRGSPLSSLQANGSSDSAGSNGITWSADILHNLTPMSYLGLGGGQFRSSDNVSQTYVPNAVSTLSSRNSSILVLTRQDLSTGSSVVPYVLAGIGWIQNTLTITAVPNTTWADTGTSEQRTLMDESKSSVAFAIGAGMDWSLTSSLFVGAEVRYQNALKRDFPTTPVGLETTGQTSASTALTDFFYTLKVGVKY